MSAVIAPAPASAGSSGGSSSGSSSPGGSSGAPSPGSAPAGGSQYQGTGGGQGQAENNVPGARPGETPEQTVRRFSRVEKVNGKEMKLEATEDELFAALRHKAATMEAAKRNAEERRKFQQEREAFIAEQKRIAEDPFFHQRRDPNFNELQWLQDRLHGALRANERSPLEIENERLRGEMQRFQQQIQEREHQAQTAAELERENTELRTLGANFAKALKDGRLPADDLTLDMMGKAHFEAEENGIELSPMELVQETRRIMTGALDNCCDNMEDAQLLEAFPKFSAKLHRALVAKYKSMQSGGQQQPAATPPPAQPQQRTNGEKRLTEREEWEKLQQEAGGQGRRIMRFGV